MKLYHKLSFLVILPWLLITASCKKTFFTDQNINPNALAAVTPDLLLPTVEAALAYTQGGDISRFTALLTQQMFGSNASQSQQYYNYNLNPGAFDNLWPDLYTSTMENDYTIMKIADAGGFNRYGGIGRILMAYTLQMSVDLWGDLPYSQSFTGNTGNAILHPIYDKALGLYDTIASLINVGTALLQSPNAGALVPGANDVIYRGDAGKWIAFGHAIKGRLALHQSKGNPAMAATALNELAKAMSDNSGNAQYIFGTKETDANAWYQFYRDRPADENFTGSTLAATMLARNDPRYGAFDLDSTGSDGKAFSYYNKINSPVEFITFDEIQFMTAEGVLRNGGSFVAATAFYQSAIKANMTKLGIDATTIQNYLAAHGTLTASSVDAAIAQIASEEYIALFLNPEVWTLWRRTGTPVLTSVSGNSIPRRLLYPQTELNYNADNVPAVTLFQPKIFWDN
jgi:hypothetical protein